MKFSAVFENLYAMLECIECQSKKLGFSKEEVQSIRLAAEEALINIIHYAYVEQIGEIEILCCSPIHSEGIVIVIKDQGRPFDPIADSKLVEHSLENVMDKPIGGLGIFMYRSIMDETCYERVDDTNILMLTKYIKH